MASQIPLDWFTNALAGLLEETFERSRGRYLDRNASLFETLETISAVEASRPVSATCASIAAQVEHVCFHLELVARVAHGERFKPGDVDWQVSWRQTSVTDQEWDARQERLRDAYREIRAIAAQPETWADENTIGGAMAMLAHTAYHLGEIRQACCVVKQ
jgi:hypothetical protein